MLEVDLAGRGWLPKLRAAGFDPEARPFSFDACRASQGSPRPRGRDIDQGDHRRVGSVWSCMAAPAGFDLVSLAKSPMCSVTLLVRHGNVEALCAATLACASE